jgi:hypothetical protein
MAHASADPRAGILAQAGCCWLLCLPRGSDQQCSVGDLPPLCDRPMAALASAAESEGSDNVGAHGNVGQRLASQAAHPSSMAERSLCCQTPEVGAECPNWARSDLCGGRAVMRVPTAIGSPLSRGGHLV